VSPRPLPRVATWLINRLSPPEWRESIVGDLVEDRDRRLAHDQRAGLFWMIAATLRVTTSLFVERRRVLPHRDPPHVSVLGGLTAEVRHAARALLAHRSYTATAIFTLALGIGANAAVFNLANWLLLRPLPGVVHESELVTLNFGSNDGGTGLVSVPTVDRLAADVPALREIAGYQDVAVHVAATAGAAPRRLDSEIVSGNYFDVLGGPLEMGRGFTFQEGRDPGRAPVVVVSDRFWRHDLGGGPDVLSRPLTINGTAWTIVGVAVPAFHGPTRTGDTDIWVPIAQHQHILPVYSADLMTNPKDRIFYSMVGRLARGASVETAIAQTEAVRQRLSAETPRDYQLSHWHFIVRRGLDARPWVVERLTRSMTVLMGAVGLLLILTAANVANLMLVRATARRAEIATRLALGASRAQVARLLLIEGGLLSLGAGALALVLAALVGRALEGIVVLQSLPPMDRPLLDWRVFAFACAAALVVACGAGVVPALSGSRVDLQAALRDDARTHSSGRRRLRQVFAVAQVVVSVSLLVGALLLVRSMDARHAVHPGFDASRVLTFSVEPQLQGYDDARGAAFFPALVDRVRQLPGVRAAGVAWRSPFALIGADEPVWVPDREEATRTVAEYNHVSNGVFEALGLTIVAGRDFTEAEVFHGAAGDGIVIISESLARRLFGDAPAIDRLIARSYPAGTTLRVVGVVADMRETRILEPVQPLFFTPILRGFMQWGSILVGLDAPARDVIPAVRQAVAAIDPTLPIYNAETLDASIGRQLANDALLTRLTTCFAALALVVAALGLYGVLARGVAERRREFGIRAALGAGPASVARLVGGEAARVVLVGIAIGLTTSWWLAKFLEDQLFGISRFDLVSFASAAGLIAIVAGVAALPPVRRAARLDLSDMLRI